jgi:hypothetical protein
MHTRLLMPEHQRFWIAVRWLTNSRRNVVRL